MSIGARLGASQRRVGAAGLSRLATLQRLTGGHTHAQVGLVRLDYRNTACLEPGLDQGLQYPRWPRRPAAA